MMSIVYVLATDILAAMNALGFRAPDSVPDGAWCQGREIGYEPTRKQKYVEFVDAHGETFNVRLSPADVKVKPDGDVITFPGAAQS